MAMGITLLRDRFPAYIFGLHEPGGEHLMLEADRPGWVLELAKVGHEPGNVPSGDYSSLTSRGLRVIVRLERLRDGFCAGARAGGGVRP